MLTWKQSVLLGASLPMYCEVALLYISYSDTIYTALNSLGYYPGLSGPLRNCRTFIIKISTLVRCFFELWEKLIQLQVLNNLKNVSGYIRNICFLSLWKSRKNSIFCKSQTYPAFENKVKNKTTRAAFKKITSATIERG